MVEAELQTKPDEGRKGDGLLLVSQDNMRRQLTIESVNAAALARLGYGEEEVKGRKLEVILGHASALIIDEELEYDDHAPDMADVLARHRELRLRLRSGKEIGVTYRVNRLMAQGRHLHFQLILPSDREATARQQSLQFLKTNLEGHQQLDERTGLPTRASLASYIERIQSYATETGTDMCVAVLRIDRWEKSIAKYGREACQQLLAHVAEICRATFRTEDVIATVGDRLGILLIGISRESARVVFNRLRWNITSRTIEFGGKTDFSNSVCIAFAMLSADNATTILSTCDEAVAAHDIDARNAMLEVG